MDTVVSLKSFCRLLEQVLKHKKSIPVEERKILEMALEKVWVDS